jgi:hypothetical protein
VRLFFLRDLWLLSLWRHNGVLGWHLLVTQGNNIVLKNDRKLWDSSWPLELILE